VDRLREEGRNVRVMARHDDVDVQVIGTIANAKDVHRAAADAGGVVVIVESSEQPGPNGPQEVHYRGVMNVIAAAPAEARIVLVTQIYITRPHMFERVRDVILARRRGEEALRASGRLYTIVRPSWLTDDPGGKQAIRFEQGDQGDGRIARADVATVVAEALSSPSAVGKTFEIFNGPGQPPRDWSGTFAALRKDVADSSTTDGERR
jgi:uncharacterized protein YbjT (DUF2867 family)